MEDGDTPLFESYKRFRRRALEEAIQSLAERHFRTFTFDPDASQIICPMPVAPNCGRVDTRDIQEKMQRPYVMGRSAEAGHLGEVIGEQVGSEIGATPDTFGLDSSVDQTWVEKPPTAALIFEPS
jgi:hypothetical protein